MQEQPFDETATYDEIAAGLIDTEKSIMELCVDYTKGRPASYPDLFALGIARRSLALSFGFRSMVAQRNGICALPIVRMQLDTLLRLYAGFWSADHQEFCAAVMRDEQIDRMKSDDGQPMKDRYLYERLAKLNPWIMAVYKMTSGHIHFSKRHITAAVKKSDAGNVTMLISPFDADKDLDDYRESMRCVHHLNLMIVVALKDWLGRMCVPGGPYISASEYLRESGSSPE